MTLEEALDTLPEPSLTPGEKLLRALAMYDEGVEMQRLTLRRQHPELSPAELEQRLLRWLAREEEP
ncbi:MAG: hypothetical protein GXP55_10965 [Deltaproteobacteria bacterium]|nr:hypothetical protein [Deltaproteobacteria bacterium]